MITKLCEKIRVCNDRLQELKLQLQQIGFGMPAAFSYDDLPAQAGEWELIQYLARKADAQEKCGQLVEAYHIAGLDVEEMFMDHTPARILEEVYGPKFVHEWLEALQSNRVSAEELYEHLRHGDREDPSIFLYLS